MNRGCDFLFNTTCVLTELQSGSLTVIYGISQRFSSYWTISFRCNFTKETIHISPLSERKQVVETYQKPSILSISFSFLAQNEQKHEFSPITHFSSTPQPFLMNPVVSNNPSI